MSSNLFDNLSIYYANLTWYYLVTMAMSCLAVIFSSGGFSEKEQIQNETHLVKEEIELSEHGYQSQYKLARQNLVEQKLTPEQRRDERAVEREQLAVILKLLQEQSETFQISSMDQVEDQLRLYRK